MIIEYNGEIWHPNPKWKIEDIDRWNNWRQLQSRQTAEIVYYNTLQKINVASKEGFKLLEIWSSDSLEENLILSKNFIKAVYESQTN